MFYCFQHHINYKYEMFFTFGSCVITRFQSVSITPTLALLSQMCFENYCRICIFIIGWSYEIFILGNMVREADRCDIWSGGHELLYSDFATMFSG